MRISSFSEKLSKRNGSGVATQNTCITIKALAICIAALFVFSCGGGGGEEEEL